MEILIKIWLILLFLLLLVAVIVAWAVFGVRWAIVLIVIIGWIIAIVAN